jgi:hypothetical protein
MRETPETEDIAMSYAESATTASTPQGPPAASSARIHRMRFGAVPPGAECRLRLAILDVDLGPGDALDLDIARQRALLGAGNVPVAGYVRTSLGRRDIDEVLDEGRLWRDRYKVDGILWAEVPATADRLDYLVQLHSFAWGLKSGRGRAVYAPQTTIDRLVATRLVGATWLAYYDRVSTLTAAWNGGWRWLFVHETRDGLVASASNGLDVLGIGGHDDRDRGERSAVQPSAVEELASN